MRTFSTFLAVAVMAAAPFAGTLPLWHWSDGHIRYLEDRGMLQPPFRSLKPYSFAGLRAAAADVDRARLDACGNAVLDRLLAYADSSGAPGASFRINAGFSQNEESEGWINPVVAFGFTPHLTLHTSFRVMNARSGYDGKEYAGMNAYNDQSVLLYETDGVSAKIGRDYLRLGPGRYGQLLLSDASPAFDQYRVDLTRSRVCYSFWGLALNQRAGADRFVNGHRLTLRLPGSVEVGLNEMVIYGGPGAHWRLVYMNPVLFYHGYALNTADDINTLLSLDADWQALPELRCWAEFLVDDFQTEKSRSRDLEPAEIGITAGGTWSNLPFAGGGLTAEYSQVTHRTYNAPDNDWERYLHRGIPTGYYLSMGDTAASNDFQILTVSWERWWHPRFASTAAYRLVRRGEGTVGGVFNKDYLGYTPEQGYDEPVPFGTVETANTFILSGELAWTEWLNVRFHTAYTTVTNPGNDADAAATNELTGGLQLVCGYRFR